MVREHLDGIAPGYRDGPREPPVVANRLLQNSVWVGIRGSEEMLQGMESVHSGEERVYLV